MRRARALGWLVLAGLAGSAVIGCVITGGAPGPQAKGGKVAAPRASGDDTPLVPLPPLPRAPADEPPPKAPIPTRTDPPAPAPGDKPAVTARGLYEQARKRYAGMDSYIVRLLRREVLNGRMGPDELILFKFRESPWSVYLKWLGKEGNGREVVYVKGRYGGKIHTLLAAGDIPLVPAGRRMALAPDSVLVRSACRHPITSAGFGACIARIGALIAAGEKGDHTQGSLRLVGPANRPELDGPAHGLEHTLPPGLDPTLPRGGKRTYFFDPETRLPMLVMTRDDRDREVEYYRHDRLQASVKLDDDDFDPDRLWGKPKAGAAPRK